MSMEEPKSQKIRFAVFEWLNSLVFKYPDRVIPSRELTHNCIINDERITLSGAQGIWKPKLLDYPISIKSVSDSIYEDTHLDNNLIHYKYRGQDPNFHVNVGLRMHETKNSTSISSSSIKSKIFDRIPRIYRG